jgi:hypothetical protein
VKAKIECQYVKKTKKPGLHAGYVSELKSRIGPAPIKEPDGESIHANAL